MSATLDLPSETATADLAPALGLRLKPGDTLLLDGVIGAGKTHFARHLIQARLAQIGLSEDVPSPTYNLVQIYDLGDAELWHADLYRVGHIDEIAELGLIEAFETAICLVEWPDRLASLAPDTALRLGFQVTGAASRRLTIDGASAWADRLPAEVIAAHA